MNAQLRQLDDRSALPMLVDGIRWKAVDDEDIEAEAKVALETAVNAVVKLRRVFSKLDLDTLDDLSMMFPKEDGSSEVARNVPQAFHDLMIQEIAVQRRKVHGERPGWLTLNTRRKQARRLKLRSVDA